MKISSFFSKQPVHQKAKSPCKNHKRTAGSSVGSSALVVLDSDDDILPDLKVEDNQKNRQNKRKLECDETNPSPPHKRTLNINITTKVQMSFPQPSTSGLTPNNHADGIDVSKTPLIPSTSGKTPEKQNLFVRVKSPEKLLSPVALKEHRSPERVMERFLDKTRKNITPVKLDFHEQKFPRTPEQNETNFETTQAKALSPNLGRRSPTKSSNKKSSGEKNRDSTPSKQRKTPKKLFERSPTNLNEFNVQVLRNFVKITPTKKEVEQRDDEQKSSRKSLEVQLENEKTPKKDMIPSSSYLLSGQKVCTKLDFSKCGNSSKDMDVAPLEQPSDSHSQDAEVLPQQNTFDVCDGDKTKELSSRNINIESGEKENHDPNNLGFTFSDDSWNVDVFLPTEYTLDLAESQHCKVVSVNHRTTEIILIVKSTRTNDQAVCSLQGFWIHSKLCRGDTVHIKATKLADNNWLVDNQNGFMVFEPDVLLTVTSVVGSVFCKRKSVLQEKFRGFDGTNKYMMVGQMVHGLLQDVLRNKMFLYKDIDKRAREILKQKTWVRQLYESGESIADIEQDFLVYVPKIFEFIGKYVQNGKNKVSPQQYKKDDWKGAIAQIDDIEENIWCPDLGLKGKVDVSIKNGLEVIPLEVKTGRASVSLEHRGQVLLYIMMMNKLGYRVSTGLLLYLKEGMLREIPPTAAEKRDIMILRNELAYYTTRRPKVVRNAGEMYLEPSEVPEVEEKSYCEKCPYNAICMAYSLHANEHVNFKQSLRKVHSELEAFLTSAHIDYFMRWSSLLEIEMAERKEQKNLKDIYTLSPIERKTKGKCLINLKVAHVSEECNGTFSHIFTEYLEQDANFLLSGFVENTYVVVSVEERPAVSSGFVTDISMKRVTVSLDRNLITKYLNRTFFLDAYDSTAFLTFNMSSLALILDTTERSNRLRNIIVDRQPASFQPKLPKVLAEKARPILKRLNRVQQRAVLKAIAANDYFLIKGMPGTGKTATIVALIELLLELKKSVLVTSHTHSAVDNVCLKLMQVGVKFMRLGSEAKMNVNLREYSEYNLTKDCHTPEDLERVYNAAQVLAVTCLGSGHPALSKRTFDICIVDESTQVLECSMFRALYAANTFILIGDPDQLPAVIRSREALELGMNESLFERLNSEESRITLNLNYRMNEPITNLANALTYNGELLIGAERIATATLNIPKLEELVTAYKTRPWVAKALDTKLENAVQFIDTGPVWNMDKKVSWSKMESFEEGSSDKQKCLNIFEAAVIFYLVSALIYKGGVLPDQIGIICAYRAQVVQLTDLLQFSGVDVNTVDQFQGKDKGVIIYSCSKSKDLSKNAENNKHELLEDKRRLNVAITRAKRKLIIVGDFATLRNYSTFKKIQAHLEKNIIKLTECARFSWDDVLELKV